jgi:sugar phosphate permease
VVYLITYLDRVGISVAAPLMMAEYHLTKLQWGIILSVFSWAYACLQIPLGLLADRRGARGVLAFVVMFWSITTALTALAWNFSSLFVIRLLFGAGEAGAFPASTRAFSHWMPATERGLAQGLTHAAARLGGALTPLIVAVIMARWGWRSVFYSFAGLGLIWAAVWYVWYRDRPIDYQKRWGGINDEELAKIGTRRAQSEQPKLPFKTLLRSRNMWFLCLSFPTYCYTIWIFMTWMPTYLVEARGFSLLRMGVFASLPLLTGTAGDALGGWLSDWLWRKTGRGKFSRRVVAMSGLFAAAIFMVPGASASSPYVAVTCMCCAVFGLEMSVGVYWAVCLDIGHEYAGVVSGMMNTLGNLGSALSPLVFGAILNATGSWVYPFFVASVLVVVGALLWLKIDPELPLLDELQLGQPPAGDLPATPAAPQYSQ